MLQRALKMFLIGFVCTALTACMSGPFNHKQVRFLKKEGFVLTEEGWSLGLPERLLFDFNQSNIQPEHEVEISKLAKQLQKYKLNKVKIVGHTDNIGNPDYNQKLSEKRAHSVATVFQRYGFNPNNMQVIGKGSAQPIKPNDNEANRAENRRVAVIIVP